MAGINKAIIVGNVGKEPEIRYLANGDAVASFSVATTWKGKGEEQTEWHRITTFGKLAEICGKYLKKGTQVYIEGRLQTYKYTGKDGIERYSTDIIASQMQMLGGKSESKGKSDAPFTNDKLDDIPW